MKLATLSTCAIVLLSLCGCSGGSGNSMAGSDGQSSGSDDPVLAGKWERWFSGLDFDFPNNAPWLDAVGDVAHLTYVAKTGQLMYFSFASPGQRTDYQFPQGTKSQGRVAVLPDGTSIVAGIDVQTGVVTMFQNTLGSQMMTATAAYDSSRVRQGQAFELTTFQGEAVAAGPATVVGAGTSSVAVHRFSAGIWQGFGEFSQTETVARVRLAAGDNVLALAVLAGTSSRTVHVWRDNAWTELTGLPEVGEVGIPSLAIDGSRVFYLEWQGTVGASVVWLHDEQGWTEWARSSAEEAFHGLVVHAGVLYTFYGVAPNMFPTTTWGIARLDRATVTRSGFDSQSAAANIDPDSRHDVMNYEASHLVSRDGKLWMTYEEGSTGSTTIRLYRHVETGQKRSRNRYLH